MGWVVGWSRKSSWRNKFSVSEKENVARFINLSFLKWNSFPDGVNGWYILYFWGYSLLLYETDVYSFFSTNTFVGLLFLLLVFIKIVIGSNNNKHFPAFSFSILLLYKLFSCSTCLYMILKDIIHLLGCPYGGYDMFSSWFSFPSFERCGKHVIVSILTRSGK